MIFFSQCFSCSVVSLFSFCMVSVSMEAPLQTSIDVFQLALHHHLHKYLLWETVREKFAHTLHKIIGVKLCIVMERLIGMLSTYC